MKDEVFSLPGAPEEYEIKITKDHNSDTPDLGKCYIKHVTHIPTGLMVFYSMGKRNARWSKENERRMLIKLGNLIKLWNTLIEYQKKHP